MQPYAYFLLWDKETRNLLLEARDEKDALTFVRQTIAAFGDAAILHWALYGEDGSESDTSATLIAQGYQLAAYARGQPLDVNVPA